MANVCPDRKRERRRTTVEGNSRELHDPSCPKPLESCSFSVIESCRVLDVNITCRSNFSGVHDIWAPGLYNQDKPKAYTFDPKP